jgi:hypothetical protein
VAVAVVVISLLFVIATGMRPEYDAFGWLVWGQRALHWNLDTNAAPSWKPLTFLFTFPYALLGHGALWPWMVTAVAGALAGPVFAGRIAYRLVGDAPGRGYARVIAALFAAFGVLGLEGYWHLLMIAASDPMDITLFLAALDCYLCGRRRAAWWLLVLISLGRPEAWVLTGIYAVWAWRAVPAMRWQLLGGAALLPALWFGIPALTSRSWFISSDVALESTKTFAGTPISRVPHNLLSLYELPMKLAVLFAIVVTIVRRDRTWLLVAGTALVWLGTEAALALGGGWNASPRYMFEPAAVLIVLTGAAIGWVIAVAPRRAFLKWAAIGALVALVVSLAPPARTRARLVHNEIVHGHAWARQLDRLHALIAKEGGAKRILACGQVVSYIGFQSILAWELNKNVADIGWQPDVAIHQGTPVVFFEPKGWGWKVRPIHTHRPGCAALSTRTSFR